MSATQERLTGWGRTAATRATVIRPVDAAAGESALRSELPGRAVAFRGLGRSYGDAAQSAGGTVLETTRMAGVVAFDRVAGIVRAEAGLSIDALLREIVPAGWFVPVTPGTRMVTLGGAVAADVHGKNHHRDGSFGAHVVGLRLVTPDGGVQELAPGDTLFDATVGGMGLTGLILDVTVRLLPVTSAFLRVTTSRAADLDALMATLEAQDAAHRYSVAWIDCLSSGRSLGRGVVTAGDHLGAEALPAALAADPLRFDPRTRLRAPSVVPSGLLNRLTVGVFNEGWFRRAPATPRTGVEHAASFFHPLDGVADWNRIYGPRGFVQYQYAVPFGAEATVARTIRALSSSGVASFLAVLKRFGAEGSGLLSFPMPGWTLAIDVPTGPGLPALLARLDREVLDAGGRLYLAKDARMPRHLFEAGYPRLEAFRRIRRAVDPEGRIVTDLSRRLAL
jgi:decaprenylphospho-beta-D-ribofuranose 2-oxidase